MPTPQPNRIKLAFAFLAITILVWGVAPVFVRSFSLAAGPRDAIVIRQLSNAIPCALLLPFFGGFHIARQDIPRFLLVGWVGVFGYYVGSNFGFARVSSGVGGIIMSTQPILIALLAALVGTERLRLSTILGLIISFIGTIFLFGGQASGTLDSNMLIGIAMVFSCGIFWAIYVVFSKPLIQRYGSFKVMALNSVLCALPGLLFASDSTWQAAINLDQAAIFALLYLTIIGTMITVSTWNYATAQLRPTTVGASLYLIPVLAVLAGALILGEKITPTIIISGIIILTGVAVAQFGPHLFRPSHTRP